ncbi:MAG TPA: hypothetical protein VHN11_04200 [Xanthobacteraceae bacterium]|nr:hypothetical protein [Xanthobacteraceae bacterium]
MSIWSVASAPRLRAEPSGRLLPDGERAANVEFGHGNYVALINGAGYLSVAPGPYCGIHNSVSTQSDLPDSGMAVWWRAYRSVADARRSL